MQSCCWGFNDMNCSSINYDWVWLMQSYRAYHWAYKIWAWGSNEFSGSKKRHSSYFSSSFREYELFGAGNDFQLELRKWRKSSLGLIDYCGQYCQVHSTGSIERLAPTHSTRIDREVLLLHAVRSSPPFHRLHDIESKACHGNPCGINGMATTTGVTWCQHW